MVKCYICHRDFQSAKTLIGHLKILHGCEKNGSYLCGEELCYQSFQNFSAFKKHITRAHGQGESVSFAPSTNGNKINIVQRKCNPNVDKDILVEQDLCNVITDNDVLDGIKNFDFSSFEKHLFENVFKFVLSLHNNNNFNRKDVTDLQSSINETIISPILESLNTLSSNLCVEDSYKIKNFVGVCKNPFEKISTEHKLLKTLTEQDKYEKPEEFFINREILNVYRRGESILGEKINKGILLPLKFQIRKLFEDERLLKKCLDKMKSLGESEIGIRNFVQGKLWEEKKQRYPNEILFPYFIYVDGFEINNPLGSHAGSQSVTAIYYTFPIFENISKLSQIYLGALVKTEDIKNYGNDLTMHSLIQNIISLEIKGLDLKLNAELINVKFILGLVLGDNLGLNQFLDFSKSFSANYYCRFCLLDKNTNATLSKENILALRNETNYSECIATSDASLTGINKNSLLNSIPSFHVTKNAAVDVMHDIFEGVVHYNLVLH